MIRGMRRIAGKTGGKTSDFGLAHILL